MANWAWRMAERAFANLLFAVRDSIIALAVLVFWIPAAAQGRAPAEVAHPALWTVHSKTATAYLLGSIHVLPANVTWATPAIQNAMNSSGTFYFETPFDIMSLADVAHFVINNGTLPEGKTLRSLLDKETLADYERACAIAHVSTAALDDKRPWLAARSLDGAYLRHIHYKLEAGVDWTIWNFAQERGKTLRAFETTQQQLDLLKPPDEKLELAEFGASVKDLQIEHDQFAAMLAAWSSGDARALGTIVNSAFDHMPAAKKVLFDDRNRRWLKTFDFMLSGSGTYFVTVGAGHLVGPVGVPALLRAKGYRVEGP